MKIREAFKAWLLEVFEEEFNEVNIDHLTKFAIFKDGWYACLDAGARNE